ncbi:MAG: PD40 domain-containing protein [Planctomycetota bacterium]|nr:PD40 domain-containing protein [Planctomycetota bacterium]
MRWLPLLVLCAAVAAEEHAFQSDDWNVRMPIPEAWKREANKDIPLMLSQKGNLVMLIGFTVQAVPENMRAAYEAEMAHAHHALKRLRSETVRVGGETGIEAEYDLKHATGSMMRVYVTFFSRQGLSYRFVGVRTNEAFEILDEYRRMRGSIRFLRERAEWLEAHEGAPVPHGLLGGLAAWTLKAPRWRETTFSRRRDPAVLEGAHFQLADGGAWLTVRAVRANGTPAEELERLRAYLCTFYANAKARSVECPGRDGPVACAEIEGAEEPFPRQIRCAAVTEGAWTVQLWLENLASLNDATKKDWEDLLRGFQLRAASKATGLPAYPLEPAPAPARTPARLDPLLRQSERWLALGDGEFAVAIDPTGTRALVATERAPYLFDAATGERKTLALEPPPDPTVTGAWSPDGKRVAYTSGDTIVIATLDPLDIKTLPRRARALAWGPGGDELYVVERLFDDRAVRRFTSERLVRLTISTGAAATMLEYPLARIGGPALSPDGKTLAFVCNKEAARQGVLTGHACLRPAGGGELQRVTEAARPFAGLQWSGDGRNLYALCGDDPEATGWQSSPNPTHLAVIPVAEDGEVPKAPARILRFWSRGDDVFMQTHPDAAGENGVYRLKGKALEAAAKAAGAGRASAPEAARLAVERIKQALKKEPRKFRPSPENMAEVAQAFVSAMDEARAARLDYALDALAGLPALADDLLRAEPGEPLLLLGLGAYYGETLRRSASAEWAIKSQEWGDVQPRGPACGNALTQCVFPFEDFEAVRAGADLDLAREGARASGARLLLVYPPSYAEEAVRKATPDGYRAALEKARAGEAAEALELLGKELEKAPSNAALAREALALSLALGRKDATAALLRRAVDAGSRVKEVLLRYGDERADQDPAKALEAYRKAYDADPSDAAPLIRLGLLYKKTGKPEVAEACWRNAYFSADAGEKAEIRALLGLAPGGTADEDAPPNAPED